MSLRQKIIRLAYRSDPRTSLRRELVRLLTADWEDPEYQEAVAVLDPHIGHIKKWLSLNTRIRRWDASAEATPSHGMMGKGAIARFRGRESGGAWWDLEVVVIGDKVYITALPERRFYPGWGRKEVARGNVRELGNLNRLLGWASAPLELILKG